MTSPHGALDPARLPPLSSTKDAPGPAAGATRNPSDEPAEDATGIEISALEHPLEAADALGLDPAYAGQTAEPLEPPEAPEPPSASPFQHQRFVVTAPAVTLTVLVTGVFLMFLLIEPSPRWVVLFGTVVSTLALDGVMRAGRREAFAEGSLDVTPHLLVPAVYILTMPVFIEHNSQGYWSALAALVAGASYGTLVVGALSSVREYDAGRVEGRFIVTAATYVVAFAMFSLVFLFGVGQTQATLAVGLAATLLAAEILREGEIDPGETLLYSMVTGIVVAEVRWLIHYLPLQGYVAALALLLAFYLVTGLLHSHVVRQLTRRVAAEYAAVGAVGTAFIAGLRLAGLA